MPLLFEYREKRKDLWKRNDHYPNIEYEGELLKDFMVINKLFFSSFDNDDVLKMIQGFGFGRKIKLSHPENEQQQFSF